MSGKLIARWRLRSAKRRGAPLALAAMLLLLAACGVSVNSQSGSPSTAKTPLVAASTPTACLPVTDAGKLAYSSGPLCGGTPSSTGTGKHPATCDEPGQPTCPPLPDTWSPVASTSAADILAALQACPDYQSPADEAQAGASAVFRFDTPVLVLNATTGPGAQAQMMDLPYFVIRATGAGVGSVVYSVQYDPAKQRLRISTFGQMALSDPRNAKPFPWDGLSAGAAVSALVSQRGVAVRSGTAPQLVDFALDPQAGPPRATIIWNGGGYNEAEPIWRLQGADGTLYFVGIDGHAYAASDLPLAPNATLVQP
jgi:hypothetical protein